VFVRARVGVAGIEQIANLSDDRHRLSHPPGYSRHRPENTLLFQLVEQHYPAFREMRATAGRSLPDYIEEEFDAYLKSGRLEEGFLRVRCEHCHADKLVAFSCKKRGFCPSWQIPLGDVPYLRLNLGMPGLGGPIVTASGLVFIAASFDDRLRAFDTENGKRLTISLPTLCRAEALRIS
jgi:Transposase zinc-binding domain